MEKLPTGRPPRNPLGLFHTFIIMRMKGVCSLREMTRILNTDFRLRKLCLIKNSQKGYTRSVLSRFSRRAGEEKLNKIIDDKVIKLLKERQTGEVDIVLQTLSFNGVNNYVSTPDNSIFSDFALLEGSW